MLHKQNNNNEETLHTDIERPQGYISKEKKKHQDVEYYTICYFCIRGKNKYIHTYLDPHKEILK